MLSLSPSRRANAAALIAIALIAVAASVISWSGAQFAAVMGPTALTVSDDGMFYFRSGDSLLAVDAEGRLRYRNTLANLRLGDTIADMEVLGSDLLVASGEHNAIIWCRSDLKSCPSTTPLPAALASPVFYFAPDPDHSRFYVASSSRDRVDVIDFSGRHLYRVKAPDGLFAPNEILLDADRTLTVADTNHHRVVRFRDSGDGQTDGELVLEFQTGTDQGRLRRIWPVAVKAVGDDSFWVINGNDFLKRGDLMVFGADGKVRRRIGLASDADPVSLVPWQDSVYLTDLENLRFQQLAPDGVARDFGQSGVRAHFDALADEKRFWTTVRQMGWGGLGVALVFAGIAAVADKRARAA